MPSSTPSPATEADHSTPCQFQKPFTPVILCGGSGTRLWPLSRAGLPKQFLCLAGEQTLFQDAVERLLLTPGSNAPIIVCNEEHRFLVQDQLDELAKQDPSLSARLAQSKLLLEPEGRNTAPALTLAALAIGLEESADGLMVVTPADHGITDVKSFQEAIQIALESAADNYIVTLGVPPDRPETGYGYMRVNKNTPNADDFVMGGTAGAHSLTVVEFTEKPELETAKVYLADKQYFWNAGVFVLKAQVWLEALNENRRDILDATKKAWSARHEDKASRESRPRAVFIRPDKTSFLEVAAESIDYAVMEPSAVDTGIIKLVPLKSGWSDLGTWDAIWALLPKDPSGNSFRGEVVSSGCENAFVHAGSRLVSLLGVKDLVVVETPDAVLVTTRGNSQEVKAIVKQLETGRRNESELHRKVQRPWGWYDSIDEGERFKVKRIQVKPGASLSLQKHHHRAEHWIVVKGIAEVTIGSRVILLSENQSTYIPVGEIHRLSNPGSIDLEIIEVQSGSYLGEDDIVRFEDQYGRSNNTTETQSNHE